MCGGMYVLFSQFESSEVNKMSMYACVQIDQKEEYYLFLVKFQWEKRNDFLRM